MIHALNLRMEDIIIQRASQKDGHHNSANEKDRNTL